MRMSDLSSDVCSSDLLRVDARGIMIFMPQHLADLGQDCARTQKFGCKAVAEYMRTTMGDATDPGPLECSCGNVPDAARRRDSRMRRVGSQDKLAAIRYRANALTICGDGRAKIWRQRHER